MCETLSSSASRKKTGLIVEGGGMKCAYSAGILDRFLENGISFDYCIGVSAGSANAASFLGGQHGRNLRFYTDHIQDPDYFGVHTYLKNHNLFNLEYIYGDLSNAGGADPLNYAGIMENPAEFVIVATEASTGKPHYFTKHDMKQDDYRVFMASSCLPAVCRPVEIDGMLYYDGGVSDALPVQKALDDGCEKLVILSSKPRDFVKHPEKHRPLYSAACRKYPNLVKALNHRHLEYAVSQRICLQLEARRKAFLFCPSEHLPMSTYQMDAESNRRLYELGLSDFDRRKELLQKFLSL